MCCAPVSRVSHGIRLVCVANYLFNWIVPRYFFFLTETKQEKHKATKTMQTRDQDKQARKSLSPNQQSKTN